jgi:hypothetical protein
MISSPLAARSLAPPIQARDTRTAYSTPAAPVLSRPHPLPCPLAPLPRDLCIDPPALPLSQPHLLRRRCQGRVP